MIDNTEEYHGEDYVPDDYTSNISTDHVQHLNEVYGAGLDDDSPVVELDYTAYDIEENNN